MFYLISYFVFIDFTSLSDVVFNYASQWLCCCEMANPNKITIQIRIWKLMKFPYHLRDNIKNETSRKNIIYVGLAKVLLFVYILLH